MLIGREDEKRVIDALVAGARLGESGVLVLRGEAGIGKSELLGHARGHGGGCLLLTATGRETERDLPFSGLAELLRPVTAALDRLPSPQARSLRVALALQEGTGVDRFAVSAGMLTLLTELSEHTPVGLLIDDAHLVDPASAGALVFACRRLLADAVFVLAAARDEGRPDLWAGLPELRVTGLAPEAASSLARATATAPLARGMTLRIVELADGNPLAVRELARAPHLLRLGTPDSPVPVPTVIAEAFGRRADALPADARAALLAAAVSGGDLVVIHRVCRAIGLGPRALEPAEELGLVTCDGDRAEFVHGLARAAVYGSATGVERRRMHALVAEALPPGEQDRRAWHRSASVIGTDPAAADEMADVGERARSRAAHAVAMHAFERAARLSDTDATRAARFLTAAEAAWFAGEDGRALALLEEVHRHAPDPTVAGRAHALEGLAEARGGSLETARDRLLAAAEEMEQVLPGLALTMYADAVDVCFYLLDVAGATAAADGAGRLLAAGPPGDTQQERTATANAWIAVGMARIFTGRPGAAQIRTGIDQLGRNRPAAPEIQPAWELLGTLFLRESATGRELVARALEQRRADAALGTLPHLLYHLARDDATTDRWSRAASGYAEAVALARELGQTTELAASLAGLTWLTARQGRTTQARASAEETVEVAERNGSRVATAWVRFALAELDLALGEPVSAGAAFAALDAWLAELGVHDVDLSPVPELVESLCRCGRSEEARRAAATYLRRAEAKGQPWSLARAARVRGLLAGPDGLDACFTEALGRHQQTLDTFEEARTRLLYGERLRRARRRVDARSQLEPALAAFERLGARLWSETTLQELQATGVSIRRRESGPVVDLTPRELQIAQLVGEGRTTRETAAALFLSPKTVEYHLRHVYTKLDVTSRAELTERVRRLPG